MANGEMMYGAGVPMGGMPQAGPFIPTPMDMAALSAMPDPAAMAKMAKQMGPAGMVMMGTLNMMGQMLMTMQGMAGMVTALQMQQAQLRSGQGGGRPAVHFHQHQHPDMQSPQWDYLSQKSELAPNSPPPYRAAGGSHW
jgi:hypothetical protein